MSDDDKARLGGLALVAAGALLLKIEVLDVLEHARSGASHVNTSTKGVLLAPLMFLVGLLLVAIGAPGNGRTGIGRHFLRTGDRHLKPLGWVVVVFLLLPGLVMSIWLDRKLAALGYR